VTLPEILGFVWNHPLNAHHKVAALRRVAWWQLASRLRSGPIALPFVEGTSLLAVKGMTGATGNWYCGLHEVRDMAFVLHVLRRDELFLDVGANIGSYTVLAAGAVGARVTSVEPIPTTFANLLRNVECNGLAPKVNAWQGGLSDSQGTRWFTATLGTVNHVITNGESGPAVEVSVRSVDDLVGARVPLIIKIDVEGYEDRVVRGADRTLADSRVLAVVMETNGSGARYGVDEAEPGTLMKQHGFCPYTYDPFARRLLEVSCANGNTIFVRDKAAVEARLRTAKRYRLVNGQI
jgi:FkbM family methyltransferase